MVKGTSICFYRHYGDIMLGAGGVQGAPWTLAYMHGDTSPDALHFLGCEHLSRFYGHEYSTRADGGIGSLEQTPSGQSLSPTLVVLSFFPGEVHTNVTISTCFCTRKALSTFMRLEGHAQLCGSAGPRICLQCGRLG